jgi:hypothetical protein
MDCEFTLTGQTPEGYWIHWCPACKLPHVSIWNADPKKIRRTCLARGQSVAQSPAARPSTGPFVGNEFMELVKSLGFTSCQLCQATGEKMNRLGPNWCLDHRQELVDEIKSNFQKIASGAEQNSARIAVAAAQGKDVSQTARGRLSTLAVKAKMLAGAAVAAAGNLVAGEFVPNPLDPVGSLLDEAIRRAQAKATDQEG